MRHRKAGRKLGMDSTARKAMFRNMVTSLMLHGQIRTTEARAKELRRFAERVITLGKRAPATDGLSGDALKNARAARVAAIRRARLWINNDEALGKVFGEYADRFQARPGGYTRVLKLGRRAGDNAPMAVISLVGDDEAEAAAVDEAPVEEAAAPIEEAVAPVEEAAAAEEAAPAEPAPVEEQGPDASGFDDQEATEVVAVEDLEGAAQLADENKED